MKRASLLAAAVLAALVADAAGAKECAGVRFADQMQVDGQKLVLNGLGLRLATMLKVKVYVAALYVGRATSDPRAILAAREPTELMLHFVRDVSADDIRKGWDEGFAKNAKAQLPALEDRIAMLRKWTTNMKSGQRLLFVVKPGTGVLVNANGTGKGTIRGDDFARAFLSIWLGPEPPNPEIKMGMLGGTCG